MNINFFDVLHYVSWVPENGVGVKVFCWVEPQVELLLPISLPLSEHIGVKRVRIPTQISEELKVYLIMCQSL